MTCKGYCIKVCINDTIRVIRFNGQIGLFFDSTASAKITKKLILADSLVEIDIKQARIISRDQILRANAITIEKSFKQYQSNEEVIKATMIKDFNRKLNKKNMEIWGYRIGIGVLVVIKIISLVK